ncbi:WYL domain-containing protein [Mesorhizobium sp.]|uniref:helix-turn-helix transcriptional regulator n=1 Tax=Mesorhizobium sp. TaxID=1871066 RepID=UPI0025E324B9|nr:WYL domain-containing protein [Mesorhizobium sp.]
MPIATSKAARAFAASILWGLTLFDEVWLLTAWCEVREDFRNFRLDRISGLNETGENFRPQNGQRFKDYLAQL